MPMPAATGSGWWNKVDGKVVSRHRRKDVAVECGRTIAVKLEVEQSDVNVIDAAGRGTTEGLHLALNVAEDLHAID